MFGRAGRIGQVALIAFGVAVASALLFALTAIPNAVADRQQRDAVRSWLTSSPETNEAAGTGLIAVGDDLYRGLGLTHVLVASSAGQTPQLFDQPLPTGKALVSPHLSELLESDPSFQDRLAGEPVGILSDQFLLDPDELVSVSRVDASVILATGSARGIPGDGMPGADGDIPAEVALVVSMAIIVLALPVVVFIFSATRFGAERRRERMSALALAGAEGRQIRRFMMIESITATVFGLVAGYGLFLIIRPVLSRLQLGGRPSFSGSVTPLPWLVVAVVSFVLMSGVFASLAGTKRAASDPLASPIRNQSSRRSGTLAFLILGLGSAGLMVGISSPSDTDAPHPLALVGLVLVAVGLVFVGRPFIAAIGQFLARRSSSGVVVLGGKRMETNPEEISRPLTAVVTGVFVVAAFFTITGTLLRSSNFRYQGLPPETLVVEATPAELPAVADSLMRRPDVEATVRLGLAEVRTESGDWMGLGVIADCDDLAEVVGLVVDDCTSGVLVAFDEGLASGATLVVSSSPPMSELGEETTVRYEAGVFRGEYAAAVVIDPDLLSDAFLSQVSEGQVLAVMNDGVDVETLRNRVLSEHPTAWVRTVTEIETEQQSAAIEFRTLATIGLVVVLVVAAFSMAVGTASHLLQRGEAFAFLKAGGLLPGQLRGLLAFESAVPLIASAGLGVVLGVAAGSAVAVSAGTSPDVPWGSVGLVYIGAIVLAAVVWAGFAPLVDRVTSPAGLHFE
ncbi:MAG TPA: FtsX-like permease family protein [Acidimicrobiia bacterium]|nr:FtsX-like permease family protein [Acidimicrobiia bacterium]